MSLVDKMKAPPPGTEGDDGRPFSFKHDGNVTLHNTCKDFTIMLSIPLAVYDTVYHFVSTFFLFKHTAFWGFMYWGKWYVLAVYALLGLWVMWHGGPRGFVGSFVLPASEL
mmetsp:Transcript_42485/g.51556  ORF Transcript_42485/g.51556 Transcript_42485/m.51556 type:complete len:111 (-) Transcript_42485:1035-1367(-)|eukprot:CAMPEP_0197847572 /NCGR_PEP_ID=MMETSP1438-20131217/6428_1 /TAXON_ID=1461541 /ORGANISM="Pterosperma sp., Strain CCMP1384" /LENGTH=110 /DNA_ID=CAMNT_0043459523 /DNA_START=55 /DNA_END=387 /DNA_ORIENTATION=+